MDQEQRTGHVNTTKQKQQHLFWWPVSRITSVSLILLQQETMEVAELWDKASVKSIPPTYQHSALLQSESPFCRPTNSVTVLEAELARFTFKIKHRGDMNGSDPPSQRPPLQMKWPRGKHGLNCYYRLLTLTPTLTLIPIQTFVMVDVCDGRPLSRWTVTIWIT